MNPEFPSKLNFIQHWLAKSTPQILESVNVPFKLRPLGSPPQIDAAELASISAHYNFIGGMAVTDKYLITSSEDGLVKIWHRLNQSLSLVRELNINQSCPINYVVLSPDEQFFACASDDRNIYLYGLLDGQLMHIFSGHTDYVNKIEFADKYLVSISKDGTIKVWDYQANTLIHTLIGHNEWVYALALSPDNQQLITSALNSSLKVWDLEKGILLSDLMEGSYMTYVMGMTIGGGNDSGKGNRESLNSILWLNNGKVITMSYDIVVWNDADWTILWQAEASSYKIKRAVYISSANLLITVSNQIQGWDLDTGELIFSELGHNGEEIYSCIQWQEEYLYTGDKKGNLKIWSIPQLIENGIEMQHTSGVYDLYCDALTKRIFSATYFKSVIAWSPQGVPLKHFTDFQENNTKIMGRVPAHPDWVAVSAYGEIKFIDTEKLSVVQTLSFDNKLVMADALFWSNANTFITYTMSYKPRRFNLELGTHEILDFPCSITNHIALDEDRMLCCTYPNRLLDKPNEENNWLPINGLLNLENEYTHSSPLWIFNARTLEVEREFWLYPEPEADKVSPYRPTKINEYMYAVSYVKSICVIWDIRNSEILHRIQLAEEEYIAYFFYQQGNLYLKGNSAYLYIYSIENQSIIDKILLPGNKHFAFHFAPQKDLFLLADEADLLVFDIRPLEVIFYANMGFSISSILLDERLIMGSKDGQVFVFDWEYFPEI